MIRRLLAMLLAGLPQPKIEATPNHRRTTGVRAAQRAALKQRRKRRGK